MDEYELAALLTDFLSGASEIRTDSETVHSNRPEFEKRGSDCATCRHGRKDKA